MSETRRVTVRGRVQGVCFRAWTADQARDLAVAGWVRNRPDGTVEALLEGEAASVATLIERMRHGPPGARVDDLADEPGSATGAAGFTIRH